MRHLASSFILGAGVIAGCAPLGAEDARDLERTNEAASAAEVITAHPSRPNAIRFLEQATFGPTKTRVNQVVASTIPAIITQEINATPHSRYSYTYYTTPVTSTPPVATCNASLPIDQADLQCGAVNSGFVCNAGTCQVGCRFTGGNRCTGLQACQATAGTAIAACVSHTPPDLGAQFFANAMTGVDQLRQRVAFALSQIFVVSASNFATTTTTTTTDGVVPLAIPVYLNKLSDDAFVNYRTLMKDMTLNAAMGTYLNMANNLGYKVTGGVATEVMPNENYARELLQLFTLGVYRLNENGTLYTVKDANNNDVPVPAYTQDDVENISYALTGWTYDNAAHTCPAKGATRTVSDWTLPLLPCEVNHNHTPKPLLLNPVTGDRSATPGTTAVEDLEAVLDSIFEHPNLPPFVCKQLIQHLVTSNPSPAYVQRVVDVFKNDGSTRTVKRGNLDSVIRAILEDDEARGPVPPFALQASFGRLRPPVLFLTNVLRWLNGTVVDPRSLVTTTPNVPLSATAISALSSANTLNGQSAAMGQSVPKPATVFSYYPPSEPLPGSPALVGPEFGIQDTGTAMARANFLNALLVTGDGVSKLGSITVDISATAGIPDDPGALVQWLDDNFFHDTMSGQLKAILLDAVSNPDVPLAERKPLGIYLAAISPEFQVQR